MKKLIKDKHNLLVIFIIIIGIFIRAISLGECPSGLNQDEAFSGYEAFSLLNYGVDSFGYHNPVYFTTWGSGMNALQSYLAIPFIKLLGNSIVAIRLPQLLLGCVSLIIFYLLLKEMFNNKVALIGLSILTICPWHIMMCRWGLESNLAPNLLLLGFFFFIKSIKNEESNKYLILSSITYGLCLYAYAITWVVVPITILLNFIYLIFVHKKISIKYIIVSAVILFVFALPLMLFLLVNANVIPEITTNFISIPKLLQMRSGDISIKNLLKPESYVNLFNILIKENDGLIWNSTENFGLFYKISLPFIILGLAKTSTTVWSQIKERKFSYETFILIDFIFITIVCLCISYLNVNRANLLHFYTLMLLTIGLYEVFIILEKYPILKKGIIYGYVISFLFFCSFYFSEYNNNISYSFKYGVEEAVDIINEKGFYNVCVDSSIYYPQIMFFDETPNDVFRETVQFINYPSAFLSVRKFDKYTFGIDYGNLYDYDAFIIQSYNNDYFRNMGYNVIECKNYSVAYK